MNLALSALNERRRSNYRKDTASEDFLRGMNQALAVRERSLYEERTIDHPFIFVVGLPRSGTTLMSQLLAWGLDVGYINNLIARFWDAPVHGIRLSQATFGDSKQIEFRSDHARTENVLDVHEFGYFWRQWLHKESLADVARAKEQEDSIDWSGLRLVLSNVQHAFARPVVFKNVLGAYHMSRLRNVLGKVIFVLVERDPLDVAVSILDARARYYSDLNTWWSYAPPEVCELLSLDYWSQIAGQVHFLRRFYDAELAQAGADVTVRVTYEDVCRDPRSVLEAVRGVARTTYGCEVPLGAPPPERFPVRTYTDRQAEKDRFASALRRLEEHDG
jgi:hypothetical protein